MGKRKIGGSKKIQPVTLKDNTAYKRRQKALARVIDLPILRYGRTLIVDFIRNPSLPLRLQGI